jgi:hypothetical protein
VTAASEDREPLLRDAIKNLEEDFIMRRNIRSKIFQSVPRYSQRLPIAEYATQILGWAAMTRHPRVAKTHLDTTTIHIAWFAGRNDLFEVAGGPGTCGICVTCPTRKVIR